MNFIKRKLYVFLGLYKPEMLDESMDHHVDINGFEPNFQTTLDQFGINPDPTFSWEVESQDE